MKNIVHNIHKNYTFDNMQEYIFNSGITAKKRCFLRSNALAALVLPLKEKGNEINI